MFTSFGLETPATFEKKEVEAILEALEQDETYGFVLRAKGMVPAEDGTWIYFDYVPGESNVREGKPDVTGKICVIGSKLKEENLKLKQQLEFLKKMEFLARQAKQDKSKR